MAQYRVRFYEFGSNQVVSDYQVQAGSMTGALAHAASVCDKGTDLELYSAERVTVEDITAR